MAKRDHTKGGIRNMLPQDMQLRRRPVAAALTRSIVWLALLSVPVQAGELLVSGFVSDAVARYDSATGMHLGALTGGSVNGPQAIHLGPDGLLYLANEEADNILRFDPDTKAFVDIFVSSGSGGLNGPTAAIFGPDGNLYVASFNTDSILRYNGSTGAFMDVFVATGSGGLNGPDVGIVFGPDGNLYVPSFFNQRVIRYDGTSGAFIDNFISGVAASLPEPRTIIFRPDGKVYVTSDVGDKVMRYDAVTGALVDTFVPAGSGGLDGASGMIFGGDGFLYVTSWRNNQVLRYNATTGAFIDVAVAPGAGLNGPTYVAWLGPSEVPTVSEWGLAWLALAVLVAGTLMLRSHVSISASSGVRC